MRIFVLLSVMLILFSGCSPMNQSAESSSIKVGGIFALTGVGMSVGQEELKGAELAVKEINAAGGINGTPLEFIIEDVSIDKLTKSVSGARKLIDIDKVSAIIGPMWDEPAALMAPIAEESQTPMISQNITSDVEKDTNYSFTFGTWPDSTVGIKTILAFAEKNGWKRIAIVRPADGGFWQYTRNLFIEHAPDYDIEIVEDININDPLTRNFQTHLLKATRNNPDAIFMVVSDPTQCVMLKQKRELGISIPLLATESAGNYASLEDCPELMEDVYFSTPRFSSRYPAFEQKFVEAYGRTPQFPSAVTAYDAVYMLEEALTHSNTSEGTDLRDAIGAVRDYRGVTMKSMTFDEKGYVMTGPDAYEMRTVQHNAFVSL